MNKELLDKLNPLERLEYKIDRLNINTNYLESFMLIIIATIIAGNLLITLGESDTAYFVTKLGLICALLLLLIGCIGELILNLRLEKEFTKKAIKNMEVKNEKED